MSTQKTLTITEKLTVFFPFIRFEKIELYKLNKMDSAKRTEFWQINKFLKHRI